MAATMRAARCRGIARSTRSLTSGCATRRASAATSGSRTLRISVAESVSTRLTRAASARGGEAVHGGPRGGQLNRVATLGGQVQVGEGDDVGAATPGQPGQPQPAQHGGEADLDPGDIQPGVRGAGQQHIGDPGQSLTRHVDDLGVQQVTAEQDLGRVQGLGERADPEGAEVRAAQNHPAAAWGFHRIPGHQRRSPTPGDKQPLNPLRTALGVEAHRQIGEPAHRSLIGAENLPSDDPAELPHV